MKQYNFQSHIFTLPGLGGSGELHWQTHWEKEFGFTRIVQDDWDNPTLDTWTSSIYNQLKDVDQTNSIVVAHSLACPTLIYAIQRFQFKFKSVLFVAPADTEKVDLPDLVKNFCKMPLQMIHIPSILLYSMNDPYMTPDRSLYFGGKWGSTAVNTGFSGHINSESALGRWEQGLDFLQSIDH